MASLKNIMNVDDDHPIKTARETVPRFAHPQPEPSVSTPSLANQVDPSTSSSIRAQIPCSSSSHHPVALEASPSTIPLGIHLGYGPDLSTPARLQSATSPDSMDPSYDRGPGHAHLGVAYPGAPSRPFVPTKLTPITGRVSRAKKGLAVHTCELCRPPKTFTRAEHLSDQEERLAGSRSTSRPHGSASPARSSLDDRTPRAPVSVAPPFGSPPLGSRPTSAPGGPGRSLGHGNWSVAGSSSPPMRHVQERFFHKSTTPECLMDSMPMTETLMEVPELCAPQVGSEASLVSWPADHGVVRSSPSSNYSTPPPSSDASHLDQPAVRSSTVAWAESGRMMMDHGSYQQLTSMGYSSSPPQAYSTSSYGGDGTGMTFPGFDDSLYGSPVPGVMARSLSPQVAVGQCSETLVTAPAALPGDRMHHAVSCGLAPETTFGLLAAEGLMAPLSDDAMRSMPKYLNVYWKKVHPMYPIIHRATLEEASGDQADVLRCAMAAVATQFLGHQDDRIKGSELHGYAWRMSENMVGMMPNAASWPLPIKQAVLLCEYYARFRGRSKEAYRPSARFNKLCQMGSSDSTPLQVASSQPVCEPKRQWRSWVREESRRRLLAACFLLSVHGNWYYEQPLTTDLGLDKFSPMMLPISLSVKSTKAWEAASAQDWAVQEPASRGGQTVGELLQQPLTASDMEAMPPFDAAILQAAHALQLPRRRRHDEVEETEDPLGDSRTMTRLFPRSAVAHVYLALHHTPLHCLLSVSGDSWVFNMKVPQPSCFRDHQQRLDRWRTSRVAAAATLFAAKALKLFLGLDGVATGGPLSDISDLWGVYVCALICWAAGGGHESSGHESSGHEHSSSRADNRTSATRWILAVAEAEVQALSGSEGSRGVIGLARDLLERDCLGRRSILLADAVGVLRKLDEGS
ncbi:hypothetical protein CDD80_4525 [Ophiocordyceps camponoti-rufipedis]|uniref:Xylanolytic transcriptional activator regulatory domain-containing protein n=1 Tax=Ophiocordyceps camponoti-rufipedis TaxID=2004952 RepID=A0A2C5YN63_9HYPO|nr:hypothetical protein CDD80_4525 [Ophiocordyceps camponoti-rufipedis]